jgi:hypothetical protein
LHDGNGRLVRSLGPGFRRERDVPGSRLRACLTLLLGIGSLSGSVSAAEEFRPLEFEVRPSGVVAETADQALDRRLKAREYLFRSICNQCGRGDRFNSNAPFKPYEALAAPAPPQD